MDNTTQDTQEKLTAVQIRLNDDEVLGIREATKVDTLATAVRVAVRTTIENYRLSLAQAAK